MKLAADILRDLVQPSNVAVHSDTALVGSVAKAAARDDKSREEGERENLRRKPDLVPISRQHRAGSIELAPWAVLHELGRSMTLARRGASRGLAEHWGCLKYSQALGGRPDAFMELSAEGGEPSDYYKALQSDELSVGFALALTRAVLSHRYPDHSVSIIPADPALRAGWAVTSRDSGEKAGCRYRPQFFAEVWQPGEPSRVFPIAARGSHGKPVDAHNQLAASAARVEAVHIGDWDQTPCLLFSTTLPHDGPVTVHALQARRSGGWLPAAAGSPGLDAELKDANIPPGIQPPTEEFATPPALELGFHVPPDRFDWFRRVLARTDAAGLAAFTGDNSATAKYLTKRQGRHRFTGYINAATDSMQDATCKLLGDEYVGTDHVFRLNRTRVEAFSGMTTDLFDHLRHGRVEQYRTEIHHNRAQPLTAWDPAWNGPVSLHPDGSVLAMRLMSA